MINRNIFLNLQLTCILHERIYETFNENILKIRILESNNTVIGNFNSTCYVTTHAINQFLKIFQREGLKLK